MENTKQLIIVPTPKLVKCVGRISSYKTELFRCIMHFGMQPAFLKNMPPGLGYLSHGAKRLTYKLHMMRQSNRERIGYRQTGIR